MRQRFQKALEDKDFAELFSKGSLSLFIRLGGQLMGFLLSFVITYYYGAKGLGTYVLAIVVLRVFGLIAKLGLDTFSIRFIAAFSKQSKWESIKLFRKKMLRILVFTSVISSCFMYFLSPFISSLIPVDVHVIRLISFFVLPMVFFMLHYESLRGLKRIAEFSFFYRMSQATFTIVSLFIISSFIDSKNVPLFAYLTSLCVVSLLAYITYRYWFLSKAKFLPNEEIDYFKTTKMLQISIPLMLAQSVQFIMAWTDQLMIGNMLDAESVAIYGVAFRFSMGVTITLMAINSIASPKFAEKYAKTDIVGVRKISIQSSRLIFWTTLPLAMVLLLFPKFFLGLYGNEFLIGVEVLRWLIIGRVINAFSGSVGNLMQMTGQQKNFMNILILASVINVLLNYFLIPLYSIKGAAIASFVSLSFWNLVMIVVVKNKFGFLPCYIPVIKR